MIYVGRYRRLKVSIKRGDICDEKSGALAFPINAEGKMAGGASLAVKDSFGPSVEKEFEKQRPLQVGNTYVVSPPITSGETKLLIGGVVVSKVEQSTTTVQTVEGVYKRVLSKANEKKMLSLSMTGFGTGYAHFNKETATGAFFKAIKAFADQSFRPDLKEVTLVDRDREFVQQLILGWEEVHNSKAKCALLVVDLIRDFVHQDNGMIVLSGKNGAFLDNILELLRRGRKLGIPIFLIQDLHKNNDDREFIRTPSHAIEGTAGCEFIDQLSKEIQDSSTIISKSRYSAFYKTNLEDELKKNGVNTILLCGLQTHVCILATALDAFFRDFRVVLVKDASTSSSEDKKLWGEWYMETYIGETADLEAATLLIERASQEKGQEASVSI